MRLSLAISITTVVGLVAVSPFAEVGTTSVARAAVITPASQHRSVHLVDMDGDGTNDRVVIMADRGFSFDTGTGHYTVRVRLSSTGRTVSRQLAMDDYEGGTGKGWSAWFGATQLDGHRGKEILLGEGSGASSQSFYALTVRDGRLRVLTSPQFKGDRTWEVNSDAVDQSGYRCTAGGVQARGVGTLDASGRQWDVTRDTYAYGAHGWQRTAQFHRRFHTHGGQPKSTNHYGYFVCHGLPAIEL
jgi:hypothetical protein